MTQQDKELLLKDLSGRLPYGVMFQCKYHNFPVKCIFIDTDYIGLEYRVNGQFFLHEIKPYLRPMSSMTEEEGREYRCLQVMRDIPWKVVDWLNTYHFDYHGLIEKGLALEAPEGMYSLA